MVQNSETKQFAIGNQGLLIFGIILLAIGLMASFYPEVKTFYEPFSGQTFEISRTYPYQSIGMVLVLVGVACIALRFLFPQRKEEMTKQST